MMYFLIILFSAGLIYLATAERFRNFTRLLALQGILMFGIAIIQLRDIHWPTLLFLSIETLVFKGIVVPVLLFRIINNLKIYKVHDKALPPFFSLILSMAGLFLSLIVARAIDLKGTDYVLLMSAVFCLYTGVIMIITHKLIFSHMIGFLVIENAVFLLSLSLGAEMPILINIGVLLDIFVSVLIITILIARIGSKFRDLGVENLTNLKN